MEKSFLVETCQNPKYPNGSMNKIPYPPIKSYVTRQGRLTSAQRCALKNSWLRYGIPYERRLLNLEKIFNRKAPCVLEIGFGNGTSFLKQVETSPEMNFIGIEVHSPGVGALLSEANKRELQNLRIFQHDAVEVLKHCIPNDSLDVVQIFFPDPWPKKRHHKRRLIQVEFVTLLTHKLKTEGRLHCATDWEDYAKQMMAVLSASKLTNVAGEGLYFSNAYTLRPKTKFEQRGLRLGHDIWDLVFKRSGAFHP